MERLMCATHCSRTACLENPEVCPECGDPISSFTSFRLPFPFADGHSLPTSVLVKPTSSTWSECCAHGLDMHVGVSTSAAGAVYCYHQLGVEVESRGWEQALQVFSLNKYDLLWDSALSDVILDQEWNSAFSYDEHRHNCFDFALALLRRVAEKISSNFPTEPRNLVCPWSPGSSRDEMQTCFTEKYVMPKLEFAQKYVKLLEEVKANGPLTIAPKLSSISSVIGGLTGGRT